MPNNCSSDNGEATATWMSIVMIVLGLFTLVSCYYVEAPYGRHRKSGWPLFNITISARLSWILQESPCIFVTFLVWCYNESERDANFVNKFLLTMFILHYIHKSFIYPFLVNGSAVPSPITLLAFSFCSFNGYMQSKYLLSVKYPYNWIFTWNFSIGLLLFFCGMAGNIHSDHILSTLRQEGEKGYKIPKGGLFEYVSAANYFCETVEWIGFSIACWSLPSTAFAWYTISNLGPRAIHHHRWYKDKFLDYPRGRKAFIPFLL